MTRRARRMKAATMTRTEIQANYKIRNGIIMSPGKFEGEPIYAPYFWDLVMDGGAETDGDFAAFHILTDDRNEFPEIGSETITIRVWTDGNGFVHTRET